MNAKSLAVLCMMGGRVRSREQLLFASLLFHSLVLFCSLSLSPFFAISLGGENDDSSAPLPQSFLPPAFLPPLDPHPLRSIPSASSLRSRLVISAVDSNLLSSSSSAPTAAAHMIVSWQKMGSESRGIANIKLRLIGAIDNKKKGG